MSPKPQFNIDPESWAAANRLLDTALELAPGEREAWLENLPPEFQPLQELLRDLLSRAGQTDTFLHTIPRVTALPQEVGDREECARDEVGPYRLLRELGKGGMGTVWLAERIDGMVNRPVALKLPRGNWQRGTLSKRMAREREILAALNHPNIARLYDAGVTNEGNPWLALEYVEGHPIDEYCNAKNANIQERLRLFLNVADAVAHAHARLVVHLDLKPSNILVTDDGQVRLLDFGIAKLLEQGEARETELTRVSGRVLTPEYASPEQIRGEPLGIASDVYSLGAVLYELLTGRRPYKLKRESIAALEEAILETDSEKPSEAVREPSLRKQLRGDLDTIILKALQKKPEDRYATTNALADDLNNHISDRPVMARPGSRRYRVSRFIRRNRFAVAAVALVMIGVSAGTGVALWQARVALAEKKRAEQVKTFIAGIFQDANLDEGQGKSLTALEILKRANERIDNTLDAGPPTRLELMNIVGSSLMSLGDTESAETAANRAVAEAGRNLPDDHPLALRARLLRAWVLLYRGKTKEMRKEMDTVFPTVQRNSAMSVEDMVFAWRLQCGLLVDEGKAEEAQAAGREAVRLAESGLSAHHKEKLMALLELAFAYSQGKRGTQPQQVETSLQAYRLAMEAHRANPLHPNVMKARAAYGGALGAQGKLDEGIQHIAQSRVDAAKLFGESSMTVAVYSQNLVDLQLRAGLVRDALESSERAVKIFQQSNERDSYTAQSVERLHGLALTAARRMQDALPVLSRALESSNRVLGPSHYLTLESRALRARVLGYTGALEAATNEIDAVVAGFGPSHPSRYVGLRIQGILKQLGGEYASALSAGQEALRLIGAEPARRAWRGRTLMEIGVSQLELGKYEDALHSLTEARTILAVPDERMHPDLADVFVGLGRAKMRQSRHVEALPLLEKADEFWQSFDAENRWAGEAALWLGQCHMSMGRMAEARKAMTRADKILSRSSIPSDKKLLQLAKRE